MSYAFNIPFKVERGESWTNPYITDGLVAMWDGEWNAGGGVHDPSATRWIDLTGNGHDQILTSNASWADNAIVSTGRNSTSLSSPATSDSIEIVILQGAGVGNIFHAFIEKDSTTGMSFVKNGGNVSFYYSGSYYRLPDLYDYNVAHSFHANRTYAMADLRSMNTTTATRIGWSGTGISRATNEAHKFVGQIFCIRLYSRDLTASEVAANYAVDKARFNLP